MSPTDIFAIFSAIFSGVGAFVQMFKCFKEIFAFFSSAFSYIWNRNDSSSNINEVQPTTAQPNSKQEDGMPATASPFSLVQKAKSKAGGSIKGQLENAKNTQTDQMVLRSARKNFEEFSEDEELLDGELLDDERELRRVLRTIMNISCN